MLSLSCKSTFKVTHEDWVKYDLQILNLVCSKPAVVVTSMNANNSMTRVPAQKPFTLSPSTQVKTTA